MDPRGLLLQLDLGSLFLPLSEKKVRWWKEDNPLCIRKLLSLVLASRLQSALLVQAHVILVVLYVPWTLEKMLVLVTPPLILRENAVLADGISPLEKLSREVVAANHLLWQKLHVEITTNYMLGCLLTVMLRKELPTF